MTRFLSILVVLGGLLAVSPAQGQEVQGYYYGFPPRAVLATPGPKPVVVYGSATGLPVDFNTQRSVFYAPGYATSYYRYANTTYTPPGFFEPLSYSTVPFSTKPTVTYTPGYYSYFYQPALAAPVETRPPVYSSYSRNYRN